MRLISHRGNIDGPNPEQENNPSYVEHALILGYDVEVDVRVKDGKLYLGHDEPQYPLDIDWLQRYAGRLWLHCKDVEVMSKFAELDPRGGNIHYFWHETDKITLTSKGYMWVYPGNQPIKGGIAMLPEINGEDVSQSYGVCSDFVSKYKNAFIYQKI
jgi:hypothetical protein